MSPSLLRKRVRSGILYGLAQGLASYRVPLTRPIKGDTRSLDHIAHMSSY